MNCDEILFDWEDDFPKGYGHTSIAYLKRCFGYDMAKSGCIHAAQDVVMKCVKRNRIDKFREEYADSYLIPVAGRNTLPQAFAEAIGLELWDKIFRVDKVQRKSLCAIHRLQHKPIFAGHVEKGAKYIIVDDVITQGGTVAALRKYILANGGKVSAVVALAFSIGSHDIAPTPEKLIRLSRKFAGSVFWLQNLGLFDSCEELTNSQARYLLRFSCARNVHKRLMKAGNIIDVD